MGDLYDAFIHGKPVPAKHKADVRALLRMVLVWDVLVVAGMALNPSASSTFILGWYLATGVVAFPACLWDLRRRRRQRVMK